jgi:hypothetical protein
LIGASYADGTVPQKFRLLFGCSTDSEACVAAIEKYLLREAGVRMGVVQLIHGGLSCILGRIFVNVIGTV